MHARVRVVTALLRLLLLLSAWVLSASACARVEAPAPPPLGAEAKELRAPPNDAPPPTLLAPSPPASPSSSALPSASGVRCVRDDAFPSPWALPEASAAAEVELRPGSREILVVGDSGRHGAAMAWSRASGTRPLVLPLDDKASDDLEGMAWQGDRAGGHLETLTSSGAVRRFVPDGRGGLRADGEAYAIGPPPVSCPDLHAINCGKNWEGLCLRSPAAAATPGTPCVGYAASKSDTALYCVVRDAAGRLAIDPARPPRVLELGRFSRREGVLSDCAFGAPGGPAEDVLLVTTNLFGGSQTYAVDEATGRVSALDVVATPSNEAIAVDHEGAFYAFLDDNGDTSVARRFACQGWR
jgi:hypothetical protein